jgi:hypothetical protein
MNDDENRLYATMQRQQSEGIDALAQHVMCMPVPPNPEPDALEVFVSLSKSNANLTDQQIAEIGRISGYDSTSWLIRLVEFIQGQ